MIGTKLRTLRESKRLTPIQTAEAIEVCEKTYRKY
jgi:transcriptional regulator with XRE-family HTH domain